MKRKCIIQVVLSIVLLLLMNAAIAQDNTPAEEPEATPEVTPEPEPPIQVLTVWLPEPLASPASAEAESILQEQTQAFLEDQANLEIQFRVKLVDEPGGILPTLMSASDVAPGALPDITLLRREDLVVAHRDGLIQPLEGIVPSIMMTRLDSALVLGQVDEQLFGLPYLLEVQQLVVRPQDESSTAAWGFDDILEREQSFTFPAGRLSLNNLFVLQYLAEGGELPSSASTVNPEILSRILLFYEQAAEQDLLDPSNQDYTSSQDYELLFNNDDIDIAMFSSSFFLRLLALEPGLLAAPVPTASGDNITILDGWIWVIVTTDADKQRQAIDYLSWLMDRERLVEYAQVAFMLPSTSAAIQQYLSGKTDSDLYLEMLDNAFLAQPENGVASLARILNEALVAVITQEQTAEQATDSIMAQLEN